MRSERRFLGLLVLYLLLLALGARGLIGWLLDQPRATTPTRTRPPRVQW